MIQLHDLGLATMGAPTSMRDMHVPGSSGNRCFFISTSLPDVMV